MKVHRRKVRVQGADGGVLVLAELIAQQGDILPSSRWSSRAGFFLLGMQSGSPLFEACNLEWYSIGAPLSDSILNKVSFIRFHKISLNSFQVYDMIVNCNHHTVHQIPRTYSSYSQKFVLFDQHFPISHTHTHTPPLTTTILLCFCKFSIFRFHP